MLALTALWGFQQVTVKWIAADVSLVMQAALRSIVATALLVTWARMRGLALFQRDGTGGPGMVAGLLFAAEFVFIYAGLGYTNASRMSVFIYLAPPLTALGLHFFVRSERLTAVQWGGVLLAFAGIVLAFAEGFGTGGGADQQRSLARRLMYLIDPKKRRRPLGRLNPVIGKERRTGALAKSIGLTDLTYTVIAGSSGGFGFGYSLIRARIKGKLVYDDTPSLSLSLGVESQQLTLRPGLVPNCAVPCYFAACGLVPGADPPNTFKPCIRTELTLNTPAPDATTASNSSPSSGKTASAACATRTRS